MKHQLKDTPRKFQVGSDGSICISDWGKVLLAPDDMISFTTPSGRDYDVVAKDWGFYATPSLNGRLKKQGFKTALVRNEQGQVYVMLVEIDRLQDFENYLRATVQHRLEWLDER